ncbi:MAG: hypothetical protein IKN38_03100 [Clostridia bacterium]|nr:hypothetical protein [Clostridia bacterium]
MSKNETKGTDSKAKVFSFRKSISGFNKEDVVDFITEENRVFAEEKESLKAKIEEITAEYRKAVDDARAKAEEYEEKIKALTEERDEIEEKLSLVDDVLKMKDEEYSKLEKDYTELLEELDAARSNAESTASEMQGIKIENAILKAKLEGAAENGSSTDMPSEAEEKVSPAPEKTPAPAPARESARQASDKAHNTQKAQTSYRYSEISAQRAVRTMDMISDYVIRRYLDEKHSSRDRRKDKV